MTRADFENLFVEAMNDARQQEWFPFDTGNLKYHAFKGEWVSENTFRFYIDESVADYMKYTNEPWQRGKNPNEGWFSTLAEFIARYIANRTGGQLK